MEAGRRFVRLYCCNMFADRAEFTTRLVGKDWRVSQKNMTHLMLNFNLKCPDVETKNAIP